MLTLKEISKVFHAGTVNERQAINGLDFNLQKGEFVTVIGGNGAGKSTLLNLIAGVHEADWGNIWIDGLDITSMPEHKRAKVLGRVFQDPMKGTCGNMTIEENLAMAYRRGSRRGLGWGIKKAERTLYRDKLKKLDLGLEDRMTTKIGLLSGGQRQAITLLMATLREPKLLLLDEHTAALDPKTAAKVLSLTKELVEERSISTLMITHNMRDAIHYGNRLIMMKEGRIILDIKGEEKQQLTVPALLKRFEEECPDGETNDAMLLA